MQAKAARTLHPVRLPGENARRPDKNRKLKRFYVTKNDLEKYGPCMDSRRVAQHALPHTGTDTFRHRHSAHEGYNRHKRNSGRVARQAVKERLSPVCLGLDQLEAKEHRSCIFEPSRRQVL